MAVCQWRLRRAWAMEDALLDNQMDHMTDELAATCESTDEATRAALAFRKLAQDSPALTRHPDFRQPLLELLDQADLL